MVDKADMRRQTGATSKEVGAPDGNEIEITPQMIEAGEIIFCEWLDRVFPDSPQATARQIRELVVSLLRL